MMNDDNDELILRNGWPTKGVKPYFQSGPLSGIFTIANLRHSASRIWYCAEPELRLCWKKSYSSDNNYITRDKPLQHVATCTTCNNEPYEPHKPYEIHVPCELENHMYHMSHMKHVNYTHQAHHVQHMNHSHQTHNMNYTHHMKLISISQLCNASCASCMSKQQYLRPSQAFLLSLFIALS